MTDHSDDCTSIRPPVAANPPEGTESVAAADVGCLQSALDDWQRDHERRLARSHAMEVDAHAKLQHAELRLHHAVSQLEAYKRSTHALRVRLEAGMQAARARAQQAQEALAASQDASEHLRMTNAELRTALDAVQWRLGELDTENATHRETLLHMEQQRLADRQRLTERDAERAAHCEREADARRQLADLEAELLAAHQLRQETEEHLAAAHHERAELQARHHTECSTLEEELQRLRTAHSGAFAAWEEQAAQHVAHSEALASHAHSLEADLQQREACIDQLWHDLAQREERHLQAMQAAADGAQRRAEEWSTAHQRLQDELDTARQALADLAATRSSVDEQLVQRDRELCELREYAEEAAAVAERDRENRARAEERAAEVELRCHGLTQQLEVLSKQSELTQPQRDAMAGQIAELENERSTLGLRVDELTALNGQLERECDRLRRDRGSIEETRRLKADNARLEGKIVGLDRQRSEAAQRHSAAVAGYMVELNQRSEALQARQMDLQKLTEELTLVKQSCEDATSDLAAHRREQDALERELTKLRATPASTATAAPNEPARPAPPPQPRPSGTPPTAQPAPAKPARAPSQADTMTGPVTVIHLEESKALCDAARDVVTRLPDARYMNALDATLPDAPGSRLLAINLISRSHDSIEAITSFVAANTYHRNVLAYCAEGANGFSFGTADFFAHPIDPDACVARLLESRGAIQRLLVVTEDFGVVGMLRNVLSRMRSSVSAALDLRQVVDLLPMVEPDVVLVDLGLPRGEGLRLVSRLRSDPKTRDLALAILLAAPGNAGEFRQHALRAARDLPLAPAHIAEALRQRLGSAPGSDSGTVARSSATAARS